MARDWQMPRAGQHCAACAREFTPGETFRAVLYDHPQGFERRDFCLACELPAEPVALADWRTQRPAPTEKRAAAFDFEAAYRFFTQCEDAERPELIRFRFLIALLLWRKKGLKFERALTVGAREFWEFSTPATNERHRVCRPELADDELEVLGQQLESLLLGQGPPAELLSMTDNEERDEA